MRVRFDGLGRGLRVEPEQEDLLFVNRFPAVARVRGRDRGSTGIEREDAGAGKRAACGRSQLLAERESAPQPGGQIFVEIVDPVARIRPAALARRRALHVEGVRQPWIAERDDRHSEARGDLTNLARGALRGELLHRRGGPGFLRERRQ